MKRKELRIGNLVWWGDGSIEIDVNILFHFSTYTGLHPIELTEDWLDRLGFDSDTITHCISDFCLANYKSGIYYLLNGKLGSVRKKIDYVHQLQNLYFALTGQELEIKQLIKS